MLDFLYVDGAYYQMIIMELSNCRKWSTDIKEAINGCGREECQTINKVKKQISLKWSEDQLIFMRSTDARIKLPTDNQKELSTDVEESTDKLNNNYQLMVTV